MVALTWAVPGALARGPARMATVFELGAVINMSPTGDPDTQAALRLAVEDVNAYFVERDWPVQIELAVEGTGLDPAVALAKFQSLAARGLGVVIGPESSGEVEAIKPFTDASDLVVLSHCSTAPALAIPGDSIYRMVPTDVLQAESIARLIRSHGRTAVVPMWRADIFGDGLAAALRRDVAALGGTVLPGVRFAPDVGDYAGDLAALAAQVESARATFGDAVAVAFFGFGSDGAAILGQASAFPVLGTVSWYGSDGTALSREILGEPAAARFAFLVGFFNTLFADIHTSRADAVRARVGAAVGGGSVYYCALAAYDAVWLAALSAMVAGTEDATAFKRALVDVAASYEGTTGPTTFDAAGDRGDAAYDVWAIVDEGGALVWKVVSRAPE